MVSGSQIYSSSQRHNILNTFALKFHTFLKSFESLSQQMSSFSSSSLSLVSNTSNRLISSKPLSKVWSDSFDSLLLSFLSLNSELLTQILLSFELLPQNLKNAKPMDRTERVLAASTTAAYLSSIFLSIIQRLNTING